MNVAAVWYVYCKEFVDVFRDRRTLTALILVPLVLYPTIFIAAYQIARSETSRLLPEKRGDQAVYTVAVESEGRRAWLHQTLHSIDSAASDEESSSGGDDSAADQFTLVVTTESLEDTVRSGSCSLAVRHRGPGAAGDEESKHSIRVEVLFDPTEYRSRRASDEMVGLLRRVKRRYTLERLKVAGLDPDFIDPLKITTVSTATSEKMGGFLLGYILPYFLIMMSVTGAINAATDLTVGERERGTLESLMTAPVPVTQLMAGKFLVVATVAIITSMLHLLSACLTTTTAVWALANVLPQGLSVTIPYSAIPLALVVVIPLALLFSAVLLATCSFARTLKEAYIYLTPVLLVSLLPAMASFLPDIELAGVVLVIPVANVVVLIRELFLGHYDVPAIAITFASTCFYACTAVVVAARLFGQEAVVFADMGSYKTFLLRRFYRPTRYPNAAVALSLTAMLFPVFFYWQFSQATADLSALRLALLVVASQIGCFLVPPVLLAWYLKIDLKATFSLELPSSRTVVGSVAVGLACPVLNTVAAFWQQRWFPPTEDVTQLFDELVRTINALPIVPAIILFALVPAVCEETLFRGWLLAGLRQKLKPFAMCLTVGLIFGLFHAETYRILTTGMLGAVLAFVCWRSGSIFPAALIHMMNNCIAVVHMRSAGDVDVGSIDPVSTIWHLAWSALLLAVGLVLIQPPCPNRETASAGEEAGSTVA